jgi:pimeloyl-ACP methyl ester carboxylesterase
MSLSDLTHLGRALRFAELCDLAYHLTSPRLLGEQAHGLDIEPVRYHISLGGVPLGLAGFLASSPEDVVLVFCGTRGSIDEWRGALANWTINLAATQVPGPGGNVHRGFALALQEVWDDIRTRLEARCAPERTLWIAGHSLGAALGTLAAGRLAESRRDVAMVYTFGSPRVGDRAFATRYPVPHFRFENRNDIVAYLCPPPDNLPPWLKNLGRWAVRQVFDIDVCDTVFNYRHVGKCQFVSWDGSLKDAQDLFTLQRLNRMADAITDHRIGSYVAALRRLTMTEQRLLG